MVKKLVGMLPGILILILCLGACGSSSTPSGGNSAGGTPTNGASATPEEPIVLKFGGTVPEENPITMAGHKLAELVEQKTNGGLIIDFYPNLQLGGAREMFEATQLGNLEITESGSMLLGGFTDKFKFMNLPYVFTSREAAFDFINSPTGVALTKEIAEETGLYALGYVENGFHQLSNSVKPLVTPDDIKGMKLRAQENDIYIKILSSFGANPTPMAFNELYTALQQKVVAGFNNCFILTYTNGFPEVAPYITDVNMTYDLTGFFINYDLFKGLPAEYQQALEDAMDESITYQLELIREMEDDVIKTMQEKYHVTLLTDDQRQLWKDKAQEVYPWFRETYPEEAKKLDGYLAEIAECNAKYEK